MRHLPISCFAILTMATQSGCIPVRVVAVPNATGNVKARNLGVHGAEVFVQEWFAGTCKTSRDKATTDSAGNFSVPLRRRWEMSVPGDRVTNWAVCIRHAGDWYLGYAEVLMDNMPREIQLTCELSTTMASRTKDNNQNCRSSER